MCHFDEWDPRFSLCTASGQVSPLVTSSSHESVPPVASWCLYIVRLCIGVIVVTVDPCPPGFYLNVRRGIQGKCDGDFSMDGYKHGLPKRLTDF